MKKKEEGKDKKAKLRMACNETTFF